MSTKLGEGQAEVLVTQPIAEAPNEAYIFKSTGRDEPVKGQRPVDLFNNPNWISRGELLRNASEALIEKDAKQQLLSQAPELAKLPRLTRCVSALLAKLRGCGPRFIAPLPRQNQELPEVLVATDNGRLRLPLSCVPPPRGEKPGCNLAGQLDGPIAYQAVQVNSDGRFAMALSDQILRVFKLSDEDPQKTKQWTIPGPATLKDAQWGPKGGKLATAFGNQLMLWDFDAANSIEPSVALLDFATDCLSEARRRTLLGEKPAAAQATHRSCLESLRRSPSTPKNENDEECPR